jgi:hypothetical protein
MIGMSRLPVMKATVADVVSLLSELRPDHPEM